MPSVQLFTYQDAIDHALLYVGANVTAQARQQAKRAVLDAYRDLANGHRWSYYLQRARLATVAPCATGTIAYDHTGGTYERQVTLTTGTWPTWATYGYLVISNIAYEVAEYKSSSIITLSATSNPGDDVVSGTSYSLQRDTYPLPYDCLSVGQLYNATNRSGMSYVSPQEWLAQHRVNLGTGIPDVFTIMGDANYQNSLAIRFFRPPAAAYQLDYLYYRRPRPLVVDEYKAGTISTTADATTITGSGTAFTNKHIGCSVRVYDSTHYPTGRVGLYPYLEERVVLDYTSATALTADFAWDTTYSAVKYVLSDPVDVEEGAMLTAFLRGIEKNMALFARMKGMDEAGRNYMRALLEAKAADSRTFEPRAAGATVWAPARDGYSYPEN